MTAAAHRDHRLRMLCLAAGTAVLAGAFVACALPASAPTSAVVSPSTSPCGDVPLAHVYNPDRLHVIADCITVTGTIEASKPEPDGDIHVRLRVDPGVTCAGQPCTNAVNVSGQHGDLVLEPVCEHTVTQSDAVSTCQGVTPGVVVPPVGTHVTVTGPFVSDQDHGGWLELHPAVSITP